MKTFHSYLLRTFGALTLLNASRPAWSASLNQASGTKLPTNWSAILIFLAFVILTLFVTKWAARRNSSVNAFYTAGGNLGGFRNGLALAGDFMSAAAFLGASAAVMVSGFDGLIYLIGFMSGWPIMTFLLAERLRNLGKYTFADVIVYRFDERPLRIFASISSLVVIVAYLLTQMVGAGQLIELLFGFDYWIAVVVVGALMMVYVLFGGMAATTWVQIIKATMLLFGATYMAIAVLWHHGFDAGQLFSRAVEIKTQLALKSGKPEVDALKAGAAIMAPGGFIADPISAISFGMALMFGTAGLPHILMRFFTVPNAKEARRSVMWATAWMGYFAVVTFVIGFGAISLVLTNPHFLNDGGSLIGGVNMAAIHLAEAVGGKAFFGFMCAVAFSTILAVVAGLTLSGAATVSHDLYANVIRKHDANHATELKISRVTTICLGVIAVLLGIAFRKQNVAYLVSLAFSLTASTNFPVLFMSVFWKRCTTRGVVAGGYAGLVLALALTLASDSVWVKVLGHAAGSAPFPFASPAIFSMPLAFAVIWIVSVLDRSPRAKIDRAGFIAQQVRSETGIGAASAVNH
ncbi:cation/acetate symporter ActP [Paraburkholderia sp. ZP32-5]|uniref:cation/acetate symporter ActP n=1 Tax=Paraburkholderia sp. ZP32-5 TaxID=2883245 RepID=UPI001F41034A|nr:cation/acetate symporter ActP [Paraburkholderia sp. ZP32-5]